MAELRMLPGVGMLAFALATRCLCASGAAFAGLRGGGVAAAGGATQPAHTNPEWATLEEGSYGTINGTRAVARNLRLPGPDFTKGAAAWQKRHAELVARRPDIFSEKKKESNGDTVALAAAAPLTALYVLAQNHGRLFPNGTVPNPLRVHVLGAAYTFEGRGDWRLLGEAMPPGVHLEVSLVLGTPREADGVQELERIHLLKQKLCRDYGRTRVHCIESLHQEVMEKLDRPHLALMFNPGFPQVHRRTWDKSLLFLLREKIPTAVSAQVTNDKGWPQAGKPWDSSFYNYANEDFAIDATLEAYGADVWSTTGSPFFIVAARGSGVKWVKNGVIEFFRGLRPGATLPPPPAALPLEEVTFLQEFDWKTAEKVCDDDTMHDELRSALETPVSAAFVRAADTVYLRLLQDAVDFGRMKARHGFILRGSRETRQEALKKVNALMDRMRDMQPLGARDWIFLKTALDMD